MVLNTKNKISKLLDLQKLVLKWCEKNKEVNIELIHINREYFTVRLFYPLNKKKTVITLENSVLYDKSKKQKK